MSWIKRILSQITTGEKAGAESGLQGKRVEEPGQVDDVGGRNGIDIGPEKFIKVSVIIPVFNVEEYLRHCLASVVDQTLDSVEIICVNDCSTDRSPEILREYSTQNRRVKILNHEKNRGLSAARNSGMDVATGQYLFFLDSDDVLARNDTLELLYGAAIKDGSDEVVGGIVHWHEQTGERYLDWDENYLGEEIRGKHFSEIPNLRCNVIAVNKLMRRSLILDNSIRFIEGLRKFEDNPFSCKVHVLADKISIIPATTYSYRKQRGGSIMQKEDKIEAEYRNTYCAEIFRFIESAPGNARYRDIYYPMYARQLILGGVVLSHFSPTKREKRQLLAQWAKILEVVPKDLPGVPKRFQNILFPVLQGKYDEAWDKMIVWDEGVRSGQW